jgi:antitoxin component YwqK of YwqJK toxin-antitoxin module/peroxiredoxin
MKTTSRVLLATTALAALASCKIIARQLVVAYREAWGNGTTKREGRLEDGIQTGDWTYYYESGQRRARGHYADDHQVGPWTYYYETGVVEWSGAFDAKGLRTGEWSFHYPDETLRARGSYVEDFEDGPWEFFATDGSIERAGQFDAGKLSGLWKYHYPGGKPKAEGLCHRGQRIGTWQIWSEAGEQAAQDFGHKPGIEIVREMWPNGALRRLGVLQNKVPVGRWTSWNENGKLRFLCGFQDGRAQGSFEMHDAEGAVIAHGVTAGAQFLTGSVAVVGGQSRAIEPGPIPLSPSAEWVTADQLAAAAPEAAVSMLLAEATLPAEPVAEATQVGAPAAASQPVAAPVAAVVAQIEQQPERVPAPVQPDLTVTQREEIDSYVLNYLDGPSKTRTSRKKYGPSGSETKTTGPGRRAELEGKPLPLEVFQGVDGTTLDITQYRGKKSVLVVVLRGFVGEVCVYCVAQTEALAQCRERLDSLGIEVVVVYPGARENEESFENAYAMTFGKGAPPYRVFYDPDLELVKKLGIVGDLAFPSTFIVDKQGIVQYAFVGAHRADRPAAKRLIELIEGMKQ